MLSVYNLSGVLLALVLIFSVLPAKPEPVFAQGTIQHLEFSLPHSRQAFQSMVDLSVKPNGELFAATNDQILRFDSNDVVTNYFGSYGVENDNFIGILALELDDDSFFVANLPVGFSTSGA